MISLLVFYDVNLYFAILTYFYEYLSFFPLQCQWPRHFSEVLENLLLILRGWGKNSSSVGFASGDRRLPQPLRIWRRFSNTSSKYLGHCLNVYYLSVEFHYSLRHFLLFYLTFLPLCLSIRVVHNLRKKTTKHSIVLPLFQTNKQKFCEILILHSKFIDFSQK